MPPSLIVSPADIKLALFSLLLPTFECTRCFPFTFRRRVMEHLWKNRRRDRQRLPLRRCKLNKNRRTVVWLCMCGQACGGMCLFQGLEVHLRKHIRGNVVCADSRRGIGGQRLGGGRDVSNGWEGGVHKEVVPTMRKIWIPVHKTNWSLVCGRSREARRRRRRRRRTQSHPSSNYSELSQQMFVRTGWSSFPRLVNRKFKLRLVDKFKS